MNLLHICASTKPIDISSSKQLAAAFFARLAESNKDINVTNMDLYNNPPPFLTNDAYRYFWNPILQPGYIPTTAEKSAASYALSQTKVFEETDVLILTMPLWNCGMPAIMKAWLDQVLVPGVVFKYEAGSIIPLHHITKVILLASSGDIVKENDPQDQLTPHLTAIFNSISITDFSIAWADGQDPRHLDAEERKATAIEAAQELADDVSEMA
ncbi:MAG: NAD(P)H-dependent oxidoreductase [Verrucomicrobia bacterium]|nr:NAD(P)H-dependent oxidoreductase [Verrucomicrobiota bacterium]MBU1909544.1 NAD(P)H-dependent oxidoreductase [Verrucomicrobiota bacterium]